MRSTIWSSPSASNVCRRALARARRFARRAGAKLQAHGEQVAQRSHLCARVRGNLVLVPVDDIHYLLAEDKYVVVHHGTARC